MSEKITAMIEEIKGLTVLELKELIDTYCEVGGNMHLDGALRRSGGHTVFGQVYEGMDIVDTIAQTAVDENQKPTTDITINSVSIETYQG